MQNNIYSHLTDTLLGQAFTDDRGLSEDFEIAKIASLQHSRMENAIAVLSNIYDNCSFIVYGRLGRSLGLHIEKEGEEVPSIWEDSILSRVHEDDVVEKLALELQFITFVKSIPAEQRADYYLQHILRMKNDEGSYVYLLHRIFYLRYDDDGNVVLALCLYTVAGEEQHPQVGIINSLTGRVVEKQAATDVSHLLSNREKEVLKLIGEGKASKEIADRLNISMHTVNGHRQNIIKKMHVNNSAEAHNVAQRLGML